MKRTVRHRYEAEKSSRWRVVEKCALCGQRRWGIAYPTKKGLMRRSFLYSQQYDPWSSIDEACVPRSLDSGGKE